MKGSVLAVVLALASCQTAVPVPAPAVAHPKPSAVTEGERGGPCGCEVGTDCDCDCEGNCEEGGGCDALAEGDCGCETWHKKKELGRAKREKEKPEKRVILTFTSDPEGMLLYGPGLDGNFEYLGRTPCKVSQLFRASDVVVFAVHRDKFYLVWVDATGRKRTEAERHIEGSPVAEGRKVTEELKVLMRVADKKGQEDDK